MKTLIAFFLITLVLCFAGDAQGQNVRFDVPYPSISSTTVTPFLVANVPPAAPSIAWCNHPANATPCTNYATTYTQSGTACPNGSQDTPNPQPSACQGTGDAQGNLGVWSAPGTFDYTVCIGINCFGPYTVTLTIADLVGTCTMAAGTCSAITFASAFKTTPACTVTWTGTGALTGLVASQRSTTGLQPKSSVNSDTAVVDWKCQGQPN
jgi:hypothetical protein